MVFLVTAVWTGFTGSPGYTTLAFEQNGSDQETVDASVANARALLDADPGALASNTHIKVQQEVREYNDATGALTAIHSATDDPADIVGSGGAQGPSPAGMVISWGTVGINRGRLVRGRTFFVPLAASSFQSDGTLNNTTVSNFAAAANDYWNDVDSTPSIWSRPVSGAGGAAFAITSSHIPDMSAVLRSRRD